MGAAQNPTDANAGAGGGGCEWTAIAGPTVGARHGVGGRRRWSIKMVEPMYSEAGQAALAANSSLELDVVRMLQAQFGHVANERVFSGPGLINLYQVLCELRGVQPRWHTPADLVDAADAGAMMCWRPSAWRCSVVGLAVLPAIWPSHFAPARCVWQVV